MSYAGKNAYSVCKTSAALRGGTPGAMCWPTVGENGGRNSLSMKFPLLQGQKRQKLVLGGDVAFFRLALTVQSNLPPK